MRKRGGQAIPRYRLNQLTTTIHGVCAITRNTTYISCKAPAHATLGQSVSWWHTARTADGGEILYLRTKR